MSMMGEKLMPSACEVDVLGTLSMYARLAAGQPAAASSTGTTTTATTPTSASAPLQQLSEELLRRHANIGELDVLGETIGRGKCWRRGAGAG